MNRQDARKPEPKHLLGNEVSSDWTIHDCHVWLITGRNHSEIVRLQNRTACVRWRGGSIIG